MADVWVLQNSDKSIVGVFGSKGATNRGGGDEDARAIPFDIIEPKAVAASAAPATVEVPVPYEVEVPVYVPSDNAEGAPLLAALNEIVRVLTNANAPQPILDAVSKISAPAIEKYESFAAAPLPAVSQPIAEEVPANVDSDEALDFLLGGEQEDQPSEPEEAAFVPVPVTEITEEPVANAPEATPTDFTLDDADDTDDSEQEVDSPSAPVSAFANRSATGMGDIVSPSEDPLQNPALTDFVIGLSSWLVGAPETPSAAHQAPAQTRRERREREEAQSAGDSSEIVVI